MSGDKCVCVEEKPSSVEVSKNAKGDYSFKVKVYFEGFGKNSDEDYGMEVIQAIRRIYSNLALKFPKGS